jgi:hypothetical protein
VGGLAARVPPLRQREGMRDDPTAEMIRDAIVRWGPFTEERGSGFLGPDPWCVGELLGRL